MRKEKTGFPSIDKTHLKGVSFSKRYPLILPLNMFGTFLLVNSKRLEETAVIQGDSSHTKGELKNDVWTMIKGLAGIKIHPGDVMVISAPNSYEGIVLTLAANASGIKVVYENSVGTEAQLHETLMSHGANVLVTTDKTVAYAINLFETTTELRAVIDLSRKGVGKGIKYELGRKYVTYDWLKNVANASKLDVTSLVRRHLFGKKDAIFLQTSGSTAGVPKYPVFTNENVFAALMYAKNSTGTNMNDAEVKKVLCILPYRLPYGWMTIFVNLLGGNPVELATGASPEDIGRYYLSKPSYIYGTPLIFRNFMDNTPGDADLSFLKAFFVSGFSISEEWYKEGIDYLRSHNSDAEIRNNYGIGEALCIGTASDGVPHREGTSGKFYVGPEWVIVDEDLKEVPYGVKGEALLRSKSLFSHYFKDEEATKNAFVEYQGKKYYRTGDYVSLSEDGYVTFYGRKKRFYQPLGATDKVNCETIEKALLSFPSLVKECAVVIFSPDGSHETSRAFVVTQKLSNASPEVLMKCLRSKLLDYQLPVGITLLDKLPLMESGKVDYKKLETMCKTSTENRS